MIYLFIICAILIVLGLTTAGYAIIGPTKKQPESIESKIKSLEADLDSKSIYAMIREGERKVGVTAAKYNENLSVLMSSYFVDETVTGPSGRSYNARWLNDGTITSGNPITIYIKDGNEFIKREELGVFAGSINLRSGNTIDMSRTLMRAVEKYDKETYPPEEFIKLGEPVELDPVTYPEDVEDDREVVLNYGRFGEEPMVLRGIRPKYLIDIQVVNETFRDALHKGYVYQKLSVAQLNGWKGAKIYLEDGPVSYRKIEDGVWSKIQ